MTTTPRPIPEATVTVTGTDRDTGEPVAEVHEFATVTRPAGVPIDADDDASLPTWALDFLDDLADDDALAAAMADLTTSDEVRAHQAAEARGAARRARDARAATRHARRAGA